MGCVLVRMLRLRYACSSFLPPNNLIQCWSIRRIVLFKLFVKFILKDCHEVINITRLGLGDRGQRRVKCCVDRVS